MTPEELEDLKKTYPKGWHFKKEFIDGFGNKFDKGQYVGNINDNPDLANTEKAPEPKKGSESSEMRQMLQELQNLKRELQDVKNNKNTPVFTNAVIQQEKKTFGTYDDVNIPADDYLTKKKTYIKVGKGYSMSSYIKNGKVVLAPFNQPLYFRREFDELSGENNRVIPFCQFETHSKLEAKFIEESPYFNITIHTTKEEAESVDMASVDKLENTILQVQRLDKNSLIAMAVSLNIDIHQDEQKIRASITKIKISQEMGRDVQLQNQRVLEREISNDAFKNASDKNE